MRTGNSSSAKRIQKELAEISLDPPCNCSAGPKGDNIYEWVSTIMGPSGDCSDDVRTSFYPWGCSLLTMICKVPNTILPTRVVPPCDTVRACSARTSVFETMHEHTRC